MVIERGELGEGESGRLRDWRSSEMISSLAALKPALYRIFLH
jgi:hypothetical protein